MGSRFLEAHRIVGNGVLEISNNWLSKKSMHACIYLQMFIIGFTHIKDM